MLMFRELEYTKYFLLLFCIWAVAAKILQFCVGREKIHMIMKEEGRFLWE